MVSKHNQCHNAVNFQSDAYGTICRRNSAVLLRIFKVVLSWSLDMLRTTGRQTCRLPAGQKDNGFTEQNGQDPLSLLVSHQVISVFKQAVKKAYVEKHW